MNQSVSDSETKISTYVTDEKMALDVEDIASSSAFSSCASVSTSFLFVFVGVLFSRCLEPFPENIQKPIALSGQKDSTNYPFMESCMQSFSVSGCREVYVVFTQFMRSRLSVGINFTNMNRGVLDSLRGENFVSKLFWYSPGLVFRLSKHDVVL